MNIKVNFVTREDVLKTAREVQEAMMLSFQPEADYIIETYSRYPELRQRKLAELSHQFQRSYDAMTKPLVDIMGLIPPDPIILRPDGTWQAY